MVKALTYGQQIAIKQAIHESERTTCAHIAVVTNRASDAYQSIVMLCGLTLGSLLAVGLWKTGLVTSYPLLLLIQLAAIALVFFPVLRKIALYCVPTRLGHHRAAHRAFEEFLFLRSHLPYDAPVILLYVSLAERYAHMLPSRRIHEKIPNEKWNGIMATFTQTVKSKGLESACLEAIRQITPLLAATFPARPTPP